MDKHGSSFDGRGGGSSSVPAPTDAHGSNSSKQQINVAALADAAREHEAADKNKKVRLLASKLSIALLFSGSCCNKCIAGFMECAEGQAHFGKGQ